MEPRFAPILRVVLTLGLVASSAACSSADEPRLVDLRNGRPNLVVLALDTFRADHLGCYGNEEVRTPNLDAFAREAVLFEDCASTSTWTLPSFASFHTGRLPCEHGALGGEHPKLLPEMTTMAQVLQRQNYLTEAFVAVDWLTGEFGMARGFVRNPLFVTGRVSERWGLYARRVYHHIATEDVRRRYLFVHWYDAHDPYEPPKPFDRMYYEGNPRVRPADPARDISVIYDPQRNHIERDLQARYRWLRGVQDLQYPVKQYAAGISHVDSLVGTVLDSLRHHEWLEESIVVVMSDHGEHLTEHDTYFTHHWPYQECLHVPLMIRLPHAAQGGRRVADPVSLVDVMPTLLDLMGVESELEFDGVSLVGAMQGESLPERVLYAEFGGRPPRRCKAVWDANYRYVETRFRDALRTELFDRRADPRETRDLSATEPGLVARYQEHLDARFGPERRLLSSEAPALEDEISPEALERLRSLGYID